jgi:hypothetical protein
MAKIVNKFLLALMLAFFGMPLVFAQDSEPVEDEDGSSEKVEQRDDSFRRQMELEDARARDRTYVDNSYGKAAELEKIDKLPEESRDNIRDQLVDVIMENGDWEPKDALEEYPYTPTQAALVDPELMGQEQEAWDEQIEKYHQREAAAFGSHRGPVAGPGNPSGQQGDGSEQGQQGGQQGSGQGGQEGAGESGSGSEGTYQPNSNGSKNEISTAGVSESALDFLRGSQGRQPPSQGEQTQSQSEPSQESSQQAQAEQETEQAQSEQQQASSQDDPLDTRGIIAIEDLDKLEGTEIPNDPDDSQDP